MSYISWNIQNHSTKQPAMLTDMLFCICMFKSKHLSVLKSEKKSKLNELNEQKYLKHPQRWAALLTDMLSCICLLEHLSIYLLICHIWNQRKKTELSELNELECSKSPSHMSSYAYKLGFLYLHAQPNLDTLVYWSYTKS